MRTKLAEIFAIFAQELEDFIKPYEYRIHELPI